TNLSLAVIGGGISYQWYSNSTNSNSGGSNISGAIGNTYTPLTTVGITYYYCVVTGSCGSAISTAVQVVVNPLPPVTITTTTNTICIGNSATLTASGAATYSWSTGAGVTTTTITVTPTVTTMYEVVGKSTTGCTDTAFQTITVINCSPINTNYTLIINPTVICVGDSAIVTLSGSQLGVYYGLVSSVNTNTIVGNAQYSTSGDSLHFPTGALAVAGIFTYYVGGTTTTNTVVVPMNSYVTLTVNPLPTISISANPSTSVCAGNSATLTASGGSSYIWSSGTTYAIVVSPTVTSTYIVIGTGTNSCLNSAMQAIAVNPLPTISVNSDTLCLGDSVLLKAHGAITYTWIPTSGLSSLTGSVVVANPTISMSYTVAGIDSSNCKNIAISNITVVTDNSVFCLGLSTGIVKVNNAFSPNGDGLNETFSIDSIANFPDNHVYIYNRWGQLVWDKPHYNNTTIVWDGKLQNGSTLYAGTYFYIVEVSGQKNLKGWVELTK
ncbi:MAG TPA: gliding motility-associated C-terminal domain-containing protein, partial [Bacteroidia bacterium]